MSPQTVTGVQTGCTLDSSSSRSSGAILGSAARGRKRSAKLPGSGAERYERKRKRRGARFRRRPREGGEAGPGSAPPWGRRCRRWSRGGVRSPARGTGCGRAVRAPAGAWATAASRCRAGPAASCCWAAPTPTAPSRTRTSWSWGPCAGPRPAGVGCGRATSTPPSCPPAAPCASGSSAAPTGPGTGAASRRWTPKQEPGRVPRWPAPRRCPGRSTHPRQLSGTVCTSSEGETREQNRSETSSFTCSTQPPVPGPSRTPAVIPRPPGTGTSWLQSGPNFSCTEVWLATFSMMTCSASIQVWCFPPTDDLTWVKIPASGDVPGGRASHASAVFRDHLYIFGGIGPAGTLNTTHKYHIGEQRWTLLQFEAPLPAGRLDHAMCVIPWRAGGTVEEEAEEEPPAPAGGKANLLQGSRDEEGLGEDPALHLLFVFGGMDTQGEMFRDCLVTLIE